MKCKLRDGPDDKFFAAKVFKTDNGLTLIECEIKATRLLDHPSSVKLIETFNIDDTTDKIADKSVQTVGIITFVDGMDLMKHTEKVIKEKTHDKQVCFRQMLMMAEVIDYLHSSLFMMHRDLHVMNWMMSKEGEPIITDFGTGIKLGEGGYTERGIYTP